MQRLYRSIGRLPHRRGLGANDCVLAVRLVPYRNHLDAVLQSLHASLQLRFGLVREPVPGPNGILAELKPLFATFNFTLQFTAVRPQP